MSLWVSLFYGLLQGSTELFPVSSLGHAVVVPQLLHIGVDPTTPALLPFLTLLHLGTVVALLALYWRDWLGIVRGFFHAAVTGDVSGPRERLALLIVVGTIPTGIIGFFLQDPIKSLFSSPRLAALFLVANAGLLGAAELLRRRQVRRAGLVNASGTTTEAHFNSLAQLSVRDAFCIGACQSLALLPGISRSGATMAGGLVAGLKHEAALHFALLLATPIILAAALIEVPTLVNTQQWGIYLAGAVMAGITAFASGRFLARYFTLGKLTPYAIYCLILGVVALILL